MDLALTTPGMAPVRTTPVLAEPDRLLQRVERERLLINGVNVTDPTAGPSLHRQRQLRHRRGGAGGRSRVEGEYGSFSGAAIDVLTKSGQQQYHAAPPSHEARIRRRQPAHPRKVSGSDFLYVNEGDLLATDIKTDWRARAPWAGRS